MYNNNNNLTFLFGVKKLQTIYNHLVQISSVEDLNVKTVGNK